MKTLRAIKLNQLNSSELNRREINHLKGGNDCGYCTCVCIGGMEAYSATPIASNSNQSTAYVPYAG